MLFEGLGLVGLLLEVFLCCCWLDLRELFLMVDDDLLLC